MLRSRFFSRQLGVVRVAKDGYALISYHTMEIQFALRLATDLRNMGVNVWLDRLNMRPEDDWNATYQSALADCASLVVLLSPDYVASHHGRNAMTRAQAQNCLVIPVLVRPLSAEQYPPQVDYHNYISMEDWQTEGAYSSSLNRLIETLRDTQVVGIMRLVNPELRYANFLNHRIEAHKATLEHTRLSYALSHNEDDSDQVSPSVPRPRLENTWGVNALFLSRGVTLQENVVISNLPHWAKNNPRFAIIGAKGVGKTTTLMRLMSEHVRAYIQNPKYTPVPFWIDLSRWDADTDIQAFIAQQWMLRSDPLPDMMSGRIVVFIDGMDELGIYSAVKIQKIREWLTGKQAPQKVVLACDSATYSSDYGFNLSVISIEAMNDPRLREQVNVYLGRDAQQFLEKLQAQAVSAQWARTPLMLRMLMFTFRQRPHDDLPNDPESLVLRVVECLWEREQILNNPDWIPFEQMLPQLALMAYRIVYKGAPHSITPEQAVQYLPSEGLLYALINANILQISHRRVKFWHRTVLDVLTAVHLQNETIHAHLAYTEFDASGRRIAHYWDNAILALGGVLDDPEVMLNHVADVDPYLALESIVGRGVRQDVQEHLHIRLMQYALANHTASHVATYDLLQQWSQGETLALLLARLRDSDWHTRQLTHDFLLALNYPIEDNLQQGLANWNGATDTEIGEYFLQIGTEAIPPLLRLLTHNDVTIRKGAVWALGLYQDRATLVGFVRLLTDSDSGVRLRAIQALQTFAEQGAIGALVECLRDPDWAVRKVATEALAEIGASSLPQLRQLLDNSREDVKRIAIGVMGRVGDTSVVPDILPYLQHENADLRGIVVMTLGQLRDPLALDDLIPCLKDPEIPRWSKYSIAQLTVRAIEQIGTEKAMSVLDRIFKRQSPPSAVASAQAAKQRIVAATKEKIPVVPIVEEIVPSLPRLESADLPDTEPTIIDPNLHDDFDTLDDMLRGLHSDNWTMRENSAKALREFAQANEKTRNLRIVQQIQDGLFDNDDYVRWATVEALGFLAHPTVVPSLMNMLHDEIWTVRLAVVRALAEIRDPASVMAIAECIHDENTMMREVVVEVLGQFRRSEAIPALLTALADDDPFVRRGAVVSIGNIGNISAVPHLIDLLDDDDYQLRWVVVEALGKLRAGNAVEALSTQLDERYQLPYDDAQTLGGLVALALERIGTREALEALIARQS
jgi:HEAT repeat protein